MTPSFPFLIQDALKFDTAQALALSGYIAVFIGCCITTLAAVLKRGAFPAFVAWLAAGASVLGAVCACVFTSTEPTFYFSNMFIADNVSSLFQLFFCVLVFLVVAVSPRYLSQEILHYGEYYALLLFAALGMMLMVGAADLIVLFIALEIMSLSIYVLVGFRRADRRNNESSVKYFVLGAVASAFLLYGSSLIYGATGATSYGAILAFVTQDGLKSGLFLLGALFVCVGFLFKIASVPFHMWMPDVYEGAPLPVTAFMATAVKAASFAAFLRFLSFTPGLIQGPFHELFWWLAVVTMFVGNAVALTQTNLKRLLAYSSIAHTGYLMMGLFTVGFVNSGALLLYLAVYSASAFGVFVCLMVLGSRGDTKLMLSDLEGLGRSRPWLAGALSLFALSMAGIPPTAGFLAKYVLFYEVMKAREVSLLVLAVLSSAIGVYVYLRLLVSMYMREPKTGTQQGGAPIGQKTWWLASAVLVTCAVFIIQSGVLPSRLLDFVKPKSATVQAVGQIR